MELRTASSPKDEKYYDTKRLRDTSTGSFSAARCRFRRRCGWRRALNSARSISAKESGVGIVRMNPAALFDRSAGNRNDCAVLDDGSALYDIGQGNLMALRDLFERGDLDLSEITGSQGDGLSLCYSIQRNGNIVARVNLNKLHKRFLCQSSLLATAAA